MNLAFFQGTLFQRRSRVICYPTSQPRTPQMVKGQSVEIDTFLQIQLIEVDVCAHSSWHLCISCSNRIRSRHEEKKGAIWKCVALGAVFHELGHKRDATSEVANFFKVASSRAEKSQHHFHFVYSMQVSQCYSLLSQDHRAAWSVTAQQRRCEPSTGLVSKSWVRERDQLCSKKNEIQLFVAKC